jgi:dTDP-4-dehydrorhamnose reductase
MIKILVTGSNGQLGSAIREFSCNYSQFAFTYMDINDLDLTNEKQVRHYFQNNRFDYVINCAAFTAVDLAEKQPDKAFAVNASVPELLGSIFNNNLTRLIQISTDYIYDGKQSTPHLEEEDPVAVSVYAKSKLNGESALWKNPNAIIIRTSWLYSEHGNNFLRNMIRLLKEKDMLGVVFDQTGTPTYAGDLAGTVLHIIAFSENQGFKTGIYNYSNEGVCSWYDFAVEIARLTGFKCTIKPISTSEYPLPAKRPEYSVMDKKKIKNTFGLEIPYWRDSLLKAIKNLKNNKEI